LKVEGDSVAIQLDKVYDPANVETKWYNYWLEKGYFHADAHRRQKSYVIVIPPPNVTGILTMGHVLNNTLQDILVRHARMKGLETMWLPGTDHAGIATQNVVEKHLRKTEGKGRYDYGREAFTIKVWDWALKHKSIILTQLKKLGCSLDWERERFTLDEGLSQAVRTVFVYLYQKGLIYRGRRIINWCPVSQTALSDEEVIHRDIPGHLWYFKYPLEDGSGYVQVATTRPETMLGDTAVAVNPKDQRYRRLVGRKLRLPIQERVIPIVADDFVDPEFGTGAVKVTPAHDPNDFEIAVRHQLEQINVMNPDATLNAAAGKLAEGKDRFEARKIVVAEMERLGLLEKVEDYTHSVGFSERAGVMIEPYLSEQWFVRMKPLAEPALRVVQEEQIRFHPERWHKTYEHWMSNVRDWCISRQLWWGHRIPVFYCDACGWQKALLEDAVTCPECHAPLRQDADVLDTWFSSWLWPFSTMGWPAQTDDLKAFFPTDDLVTGPDIIFFWVARMIMASLEFMHEIPFTDVYFTGIIRDIKGRKMSKSLGNSPDPLVLIDKYGADALRYGVMLIAPQGQDILFSEERLEVGRNFMNKIWNASRFILMNLEDPEILKTNMDSESLELTLADEWILSRLTHAIKKVNKNLHTYRFDEIARLIYDFAWSEYCDWYIELIKERLYKGKPLQKRTVQIVSIYILKNLLKLLHPYVPFITEEIYQHLKAPGELDIILAEWPVAYSHYEKKAVDAEFKILQEVITALRTMRGEMNIPPGAYLTLIVRGKSENPVVALMQNPEIAKHIRNLVRVSELQVAENIRKPHPASTVMVQSAEFFVPLRGLIDLEAERNRLQKELQRLENLTRNAQAKLDNENFTCRAPADVVQKEKAKVVVNTEQIHKLREHIDALKD
jgi:valyl-tRNA synthetase